MNFSLYIDKQEASILRTFGFSYKTDKKYLRSMSCEKI